MMDWPKYMATHPQADYPDLNVVRFAKQWFRPPLEVLDIGCGAGANALFLATEGFSVTAVDPAADMLTILGQRAVDLGIFDNLRVIRGGIKDVLQKEQTKFDFILDFNTLCHLEDAYWQRVHWALRAGGRFLSVSPAEDTWRGTLDGKGFCRVASELEVREMLSMFYDVKIHRAEYPDFKDHQITSWVAEAVK